MIGDIMHALAAGDYNSAPLTPQDVASSGGGLCRVMADLSRKLPPPQGAVCAWKPGTLATPYLRRCFDLALPGAPVVVCMSSAFARHTWGVEIVSGLLPSFDVTHVIDLSGAYVPGHGEPTVIIAARARPPVDPDVRVLRCLHSEPKMPPEPRAGLVWSSVLRHFDTPGMGDDWTRCDLVARETLAVHPWLWLSAAKVPSANLLGP